MKRLAVLLLMAGCLVHGSLAVAQSAYGDMLRVLGGLMNTLDALETQQGNKEEETYWLDMLNRASIMMLQSAQ